MRGAGPAVGPPAFIKVPWFGSGGGGGEGDGGRGGVGGGGGGGVVRGVVLGGGGDVAFGWAPEVVCGSSIAAVTGFRSSSGLS